MKIQLSSIVCVVKLVRKAVLAFFVEMESVSPGLIPYRSHCDRLESEPNEKSMLYVVTWSRKPIRKLKRGCCRNATCLWPKASLR